MNPPKRLIVTRPAAEAAHWVQALQSQGQAALALPLIDIAPPLDAAPLQQALQSPKPWQALMFVSGQAVAGFFALAGPWPPPAPWSHPRAWAPGPGTARRLLQAGWPADWLDQPSAQAEQFDSEALWQQVASQVQPGSRVLILQGSDATGQQQGRRWLAERIEQAGGVVQAVQTYRRLPPALTPEQLQQAQAALQDGSCWLFSSSEAVDNLRAALAQADFSRSRALTTHARIAEAARRAGFAQVRSCRPLLDDVLRSIKSAP